MILEPQGGEDGWEDEDGSRTSDFNGDWNRRLESNKRRLQLNHLSGKSVVIKIVIILFFHMKIFNGSFWITFPWSKVRNPCQGFLGPGTLDSVNLNLRIKVKLLGLQNFLLIIFFIQGYMDKRCNQFKLRFAGQFRSSMKKLESFENPIEPDDPNSKSFVPNPAELIEDSRS